MLLDSGRGAAAYNMACDEALLEHGRTLAHPVLRFYGWLEPAVSFGYSQRYAEIASLTKLRPLVRRPTGGGLVPHQADWTYSVMFPPGHPWYQLRAVDSYAKIHDWLRTAFSKLGIETELCPTARPDSPGQCFIGAEKSDLLWHGRKIAGAAQRRNRYGLLVQGSVQPPPLQLDRSDWEQAVCKCAEEAWQVRWRRLTLPNELRARVEQLLHTKYRLASYHQHR